MIAIVIPSYAEYSTLPKTLLSLEESAQGEDLFSVVVVVNQPKDASPEKKNDNQKTLEWFSRNSFSFNLHVLDQMKSALIHGVGEARKIGMDFAVQNLLKDP